MGYPVKAVILAAGRAVRMGAKSLETPKSLMPLGPLSSADKRKVSFIERQIALLRHFGVSDIYVVVNYKAEMFRDTLGDQVIFIPNRADDISRSGSLHSFQFAMNSPHGILDGSSHVLLMDADIAYEGMLMQNILSELAEDNTVFVSEMIHSDQEEVRVYGSIDKPAFIGKGLSSDQVGGLACIGEATGICHFHPESHALIRSITDRLLGNPLAPTDSMHYKGFSSAKQMTEHEDLAQWLMMLGRMKAVVIAREIRFMEVDFAAEYEAAVNVLYPDILNADEAHGIKPVL